MSQSIRYDVSLLSRLARAFPIVLAYLALVVFVFLSLPQHAQRIPLESMVAIGVIGLARYGWLLTHCVRAAIYEHYYYPKLRFEADSLPAERKFPARVFFIVPTFGEKPDVSRQMLGSVLDEATRIPSEVTVVINAGSAAEDSLFRQVYAERIGVAANVRLLFIRQRGGKRGGMADCLHELMSAEVGENDAIILMDGDTVLGQGILERCLPLFALRPKLGAVTTDNISVTTGNFLYRYCSEYMRAFSRQVVQGLWLTGFKLTGDAAQISLSGGVLDPELLPIYIQRLGKEPAMRGKSFSTLQMQQHQAEAGKENKSAAARYVEFTLYSTPDSGAPK